MTLAEQIYDLVKTKNNVSFAELSRDFPNDFKGGQHAICAPNNENLIIWCDMKKEASDAITSLLLEKKVHFYPTSPLTYIADGVMLNMPLAKMDRKYKKEHWIPVVIRAGEFKHPEEKK